MCAVSTFWTSVNAGSGVITTSTTGDTQTPDPVRFPGSSVGAVPAAYTTSARAVYPVRDGVTEVSSQIQTLAIDPKTGTVDYNRYPSTFWTDDTMATLATDPADFTNWHSAFQAEYIARLSEENGDDPPEYVIGLSTSPSAIYMLDDKNRPVNLLSLTLSDYVMLSDDEKARFGANLISSGHLENLGLSTSNAERTTLIGPTGNANSPGLKDYLATINGSTLSSVSAENTARKALFSTQIQMLIDKVTVPVPAVPAVTNELPAFNTEKILAEAADIMARFNIVQKFVAAPRPTAITITGHIEMGRTDLYGLDFDESASSSTLVKVRVNCLDEGVTMDKGIKAFIAAETEILNMKQRREVIAVNSSYRDPNLDVPNLIYQLQLLYEGEQKGVVDAGTEEFRQLHKLLEDYNVMQQLLSTTIAAFDTSKTDDKRRFMNIGVKDDGEVDEKTMIDYDVAGDRNGSSIDYNDYDETYSNGASSINVDSSPIYHWSVLANYTDSLSTLHRDFLDDLENYDWTLSVKPDSHTIEGDYEGKLSRQQMLAFSMFVDEPWATHSTRNHPIEDLYGAERPKFDLVDQSVEGAGALKLLSKNAFDQFQTQISNSITILNQQNQIKQNDVENATKEQNRHFELGSNALRKMNDLLLMIGRM